MTVHLLAWTLHNSFLRGSGTEPVLGVLSVTRARPMSPQSITWIQMGVSDNRANDSGFHRPANGRRVRRSFVIGTWTGTLPELDGNSNSLPPGNTIGIPTTADIP